MDEYIKIKAITLFQGKTQIKLYDDSVYETFFSNDGKDKVEIEGVLYEIDNPQWLLKRCHYQYKKEVL